MARTIETGIGREAISKYICTQCGYVYDPAQGDPMNDVAPPTAFDDLPEAWVCPMCYAGRDMFDELE